MSQLNPEIYGPPESAFNTQMIDREIGSMTVQEVCVCVVDSYSFPSSHL